MRTALMSPHRVVPKHRIDKKVSNHLQRNALPSLALQAVCDNTFPEIMYQAASPVARALGMQSMAPVARMAIADAARSQAELIRSRVLKRAVVTEKIPPIVGGTQAIDVLLCHVLG